MSLYGEIALITLEIESDADAKLPRRQELLTGDDT